MRVSKQTVAPAQEPLTLAEVKHHLRVADDVTEDDAYIAGLTVASRIKAEEYTARAFLTQTWDTRFDGFATSLWLPNPPLQSITSIIYLTGAGGGATDTVASTVYGVDTWGPLGRVWLAYGQSWPTPLATHQSVRVTHVCGYGDNPSDVPETLRQGMLLMIGDMYENRETGGVGTVAFAHQMSTTVESLLGPSRIAMP